MNALSGTHARLFCLCGNIPFSLCLQGTQFKCSWLCFEATVTYRSTSFPAVAAAVRERCRSLKNCRRPCSLKFSRSRTIPRALMPFSVFKICTSLVLTVVVALFSSLIGKLSQLGVGVRYYDTVCMCTLEYCVVHLCVICFYS